MNAVDLSLCKSVMDYSQYFALVKQLAEQNQTSGLEQSAQRIQATRLNAQRMKRLTTTLELLPEIKMELSQTRNQWKWFILSEAWCGDGAQNIPVIAKIASFLPNVSLQILLRDENPEIMDAYLTNGSRSIPKLICLDDKNREVGTWGPRPQAIQQKVLELKKQNPTISHDDFLLQLHSWYAQDKGISLQQEIISLLKKWQNGSNG